MNFRMPCLLLASFVVLPAHAFAQTYPPATGAPTTTATEGRSRAETLLLDRIAADPDDATPYLDLAKLYLREERFEDAAKLTEAATTILRRAQVTRVPRVRESLIVNASPVTTGTPLRTPPITPPAVAATGMIEPRKILHVMPIYPEGARTAGVQGIVVIEAVIDRQGNVTEPRVIQSVPLLDDAALTAIRQWKYRPTRVDGVAVPFSMTLTVAFGLK